MILLVVPPAVFHDWLIGRKKYRMSDVIIFYDWMRDSITSYVRSVSCEIKIDFFFLSLEMSYLSEEGERKVLGLWFWL
jgi:hypothetical protein